MNSPNRHRKSCGGNLIILSLLGVLAVLASVPNTTAAQQVNSLIRNQTTTSILQTVVTVNDDIANGSWSFEETNMDAANRIFAKIGTPNGFLNNRNEFFFSENGTDRIVVDGDTPWDVSFDIKLDGTFADPRKAFNFVVFSGSNSNINLTTNRSVQPNTGAGDPPGEVALFGGQYNFLRLAGPFQGATGPEGDYNLNGIVDAADYSVWLDNLGSSTVLPSESTSAATPGLVDQEDYDFWKANFGGTLANQPNPDAGYNIGDTVHMDIVHRPSSDGGVTPSTIEFTYTDGSTVITTGEMDLRNSGVFDDNSNLGFIAQGIAHLDVGVDSYSIDISNFVANIGLPESAGSGNAIPEPASGLLMTLLLASRLGTRNRSQKRVRQG